MSRKIAIARPDAGLVAGSPDFVMASARGGRPNENSAMADVQEVIDTIGASFKEFKASHSAELEALSADVQELNSKFATGRALGGGSYDILDERSARAEREAFTAFARSGRIQAAMTTDSNPDGGYLVPTTIDRDVARLARDVSPMRRLARVIQVGGGQYEKLVSQNGTQAEWTTEKAARNETQGLKLAKLAPAIHELTAMPAVTQTLLDDATIDVASELSLEIANAFADKESQAFIAGDGVTCPYGILSYNFVANNSWAWGKIGYMPTGDASGFLAPTTSVSPADALVDLTYSLKASYRQNASWLMSGTTAAKVRKFKDANGAPIWTDSIQAGQPSMLLGFPVFLDENMPAVEAGKFPIAFGDFQRGYLILDRMGIRVMRDPYTARPYVRFYTTKRVGGTVVDFNAFKVLKVASS
ncbi:MAG: phage major capsid protein [Hyphomicrobium sp.]|jgi:HK97 family phage major capsid protein